jgi:hypothetical protein
MNWRVIIFAMFVIGGLVGIPGKKPSDAEKTAAQAERIKKTEEKIKEKASKKPTVTRLITQFLYFIVKQQ